MFSVSTVSIKQHEFELENCHYFMWYRLYNLGNFTDKFKGPMFVFKIDSVLYNDGVVKFYANNCYFKYHSKRENTVEGQEEQGSKLQKKRKRGKKKRRKKLYI